MGFLNCAVWNLRFSRHFRYSTNNVYSAKNLFYRLMFWARFHLKKNFLSNKGLKNWCIETCTQYYLVLINFSWSVFWEKCVRSINLANWRQVFFFFPTLWSAWALMPIIVPKTISRIKAMGWPRDHFLYHSRLYPKTSLRSKEFSNLFFLVLEKLFLISQHWSDIQRWYELTFLCKCTKLGQVDQRQECDMGG